jgi:hypothetical protein
MILEYDLERFAYIGEESEFRRILNRLNNRLMPVIATLHGLEQYPEDEERNNRWLENRMAFSHVLPTRFLTWNPLDDSFTLNEYWVFYLRPVDAFYVDTHPTFIINNEEKKFKYVAFTKAGWAEIQAIVYKLSNVHYFNKATFDAEHFPLAKQAHWPDGFPYTDEAYKLTQWPDPEISRDLINNDIYEVVGLHINPPKFRRKFARVIRSLTDFNENSPFVPELGAKARLQLDFPHLATAQELAFDGLVLKLIENDDPDSDYENKWVIIEDEVNPTPDILEAYGLRCEDDYFGPWIVEDLDKALELLITTTRLPSSRVMHGGVSVAHYHWNVRFNSETGDIETQEFEYGIGLPRNDANFFAGGLFYDVPPAGPPQPWPPPPGPPPFPLPPELGAFGSLIPKYFIFLNNPIALFIGGLAMQSEVYGLLDAPSTVVRTHIFKEQITGRGVIKYTEIKHTPHEIVSAQYYIKTGGISFDPFSKNRPGDIGNYVMRTDAEGNEYRVELWTPIPTSASSGAIVSGTIGNEAPYPGRPITNPIGSWFNANGWFVTEIVLLVDWDFSDGD